MFLAWICWGVSVAAVLASYYFSHIALRKAISQVDAGTIYDGTAGGLGTTLTYVCNALGGLLFIVGVGLLALFVWSNMGGL